MFQPAQPKLAQLFFVREPRIIANFGVPGLPYGKLHSEANIAGPEVAFAACG
jgi:hypothetical protein